MTWLKKHDVFSKAIAVAIAVFLWMYVVSVNNFEEDYKVRNVEPLFVGMDELMTSKNLMVVGDYSVDIVVSGSRNDIMRLNEADIEVEVDLSKITSAGTYELPYTVTLPSAAYTLKEKTPNKLTVKFDEEDISSVPVRLVTEGLAANGYVVDKSGINIVPREIKLSGLQEDVEKVAYAEVDVEQEDAKSTITGKFGYSFYDTDGKLIKGAGIKADYESVDVTIPVLKTKTVPLSLEIQGSDFFKKYVK